MTKKLFLMRHGETLFNQLKKVQGACDSPLTEKGIQQAHLAREYFQERNIQFDHLYASTQERACDTLEIVTGSKNYQRLKELKEMGFGSFEGEQQFLQPLGPEYFDSFYLQFGGESMSGVQKRITAALHQIMAKDDHQNVLAVSHNGACISFLQTIWQGDGNELVRAFPNCAIFILNYADEKFQLEDIIDPATKQSIL
ncbi:histidine phosphatase family protein [Enterococcus hulanensis]|uniref:histidine phosphatase family protein n=1 Tax=Enterococcus hulanensis TaxID=2559929 RepID=UPI001A8E16DA|nr:histidine phosphatase family protein [Enterococcus hulanensis]MBO0455647.1 histidine phosphatase family protein [Enterococcus hulanensis]MDT2660451.1 histidine phosphatase family protein [Enterococcus hulanensis]